MNIKIGWNKTPAKIDKEDYNKLKKTDWYLCNTDHGYVALKRKVGQKRVNGNIRYIYKQEYLHRWIMQPPKGFEVDHINGNRLDNRRCNLRICKGFQNVANRGPQKGLYKGVHLAKKYSKWCSQITAQQKCRTLGYFDCQHCAAKAYNKASLQYHGEFGYQNKVEDCNCE